MKYTFLLTICFFSFSNLVFAQCNEDRHSTNWYDGWISCEKEINPNGINDVSHWILYNLKSPKKLGKLHIWNLNNPKDLFSGIKDVIIDYSMDGETWTNLGTYIFDPASGQGNYNGFEGPDFDGIEAQYVLITAKSTWGSNHCAGLSEIRFEILNPVATENPEQKSTLILKTRAFPNPFVYHTNIDVKSNSDAPIFYTMTDALGRTVIPESKSMHKNIRLNFTKMNLVSGVYFIKVRQGNMIGNVKITKIK